MLYHRCPSKINIIIIHPLNFFVSVGLEAHLGQGKSKIRESIIHDILDNLLFIKEQEDDLLPLILCRHPQNITMVIDFIYQRMDAHVHEKKDTFKVSN